MGELISYRIHWRNKYTGETGKGIKFKWVWTNKNDLRQYIHNMDIMYPNLQHRVVII